MCGYRWREGAIRLVDEVDKGVSTKKKKKKTTNSIGERVIRDGRRLSLEPVGRHAGRGQFTGFRG